MFRNPIIQEDLERIVSAHLPWEQLFNQSVLISGANGFLPAYMLETLLYLNESRGAEIRVIAMVRNLERAMRRLGHLRDRLDLSFLVQDVRDTYTGPAAVDYVIHAASQATPKFFGVDPAGTFEANVSGTRNLLQLARDAQSKSFLFFSSGEVYGSQAGLSPIVNESSFGSVDPLNIRSCYAEGKRAGETLCACWHAQYGVPAKVARISHTYGPGMDLQDGRVFADFVADVVHGRDIVMKSDGSARRPFCYLADATIAYFTVLLRGNSGEAYNVGTDVEHSVLELAETLCDLFPERNCRVVRWQRGADDPYLASKTVGGHLDISKIRGLGWEPTTDIRKGFTRTVLSYLSNGAAPSF